MTTIRACRDSVVTRATVGHLRSYPYAMGHGHKDLLKRPILDDHVSRGKATVRRTLEVVCEFLCYFQFMLYLVMHLVSYALFLIVMHSFIQVNS